MPGSKEYQAAWHQQNRARRMPEIQERKRRHKAEMAEWIRELKSTTPCTDCHRQYPYYVMQYDHLGDKILNIGEIVSRCWSKARIQSEIDKCELVCANCHAERTHQRRVAAEG